MYAQLSDRTFPLSPAEVTDCARGIDFQAPVGSHGHDRPLPQNILGESANFTLVHSDSSVLWPHEHSLRLSEILFDAPHRHAVLMFNFHCGPMCGDNETVLFAKAGHKWKYQYSCVSAIS